MSKPTATTTIKRPAAKGRLRKRYLRSVLANFTPSQTLASTENEKLFDLLAQTLESRLRPADILA
jgi:hypothetical protein